MELGAGPPTPPIHGHGEVASHVVTLFGLSPDIGSRSPMVPMVPQTRAMTMMGPLNHSLHPSPLQGIPGTWDNPTHHHSAAPPSHPCTSPAHYQQAMMSKFKKLLAFLLGACFPAVFSTWYEDISKSNIRPSWLSRRGIDGYPKEHLSVCGMWKKNKGSAGHVLLSPPHLK